MKRSFLTLVLFSFIFSKAATAADYYNKNAGFGFWYPASWKTVENGRSATTSGGEYSTETSEIFIGSDWVSMATTLPGLKLYLQNENGPGTTLEAFTFAELEGFRIGNEIEGELYLLREPKNVMVIQYSLKGSGYRLEQAMAVLNSIYIRTDPYEN